MESLQDPKGYYNGRHSSYPQRNEKLFYAEKRTSKIAILFFTSVDVGGETIRANVRDIPAKEEVG